MQEDPIWFNAGDLNVHRYVGNNPFNATDPSGMLAGDEKAIKDAIAVRVLLNGQIARRQMLSTGARTAQYLASDDKNTLSTIAANISCTFFILADAIEQSGPNTEIVGVDRSKCGVVAMSVQDPDRDMLPILPPARSKRGECSCNCRAVPHGSVENPPITRFARWSQPDNPSCRSTATKACGIARTRLAVQSRHPQALCSYNGGKPFEVYGN